MGTFFTCGATKQDIINELLEPLKTKKHLVVHKVTSEDGEPVLWTVEKGEKNGHPYQFIGCYVLRKADGDWGYKPMDETMGPCFYSVPLDWISRYPCIMTPEHQSMLQYSEHWRKTVRQMTCQLT